MVYSDSITASTVTSVDNVNTVYPPPSLTKEEIVASRYYIKKFLSGDITIEFTRDAGLLHQYYRIRDQEFKAVLQSDDYAQLEDEYDENGYIAVARIGNFCIGGMRLNVKTPRRSLLLPLETNDFRLAHYFPELKYRELIYAQISGFAILQEMRNGSVCHNLTKRLYSKALSLNVHIGFFTAPKANARLYKIDCVSLGIKNTKIHTDIVLPQYNDTDYLISIPLHEIAGKSLVPPHQDDKDSTPDMLY